MSYQDRAKVESDQSVTVTREMIEAGANVIEELREFMDSWAMAERVYIAMRERQPLEPH
jgi:hypothetical protein